MRFPREKALIINKINEYKNNEDYYAIAKMKNLILENYRQCDAEIYEDLIRATFAIGNYDEDVYKRQPGSAGQIIPREKSRLSANRWLRNWCL